YCGGVTVAIGSICRKPSCRTVSRTPAAEPSSNCARTAMRRACARLAVVDFATFALSHLPAPPARVLEVGCGRRGGITPALAAAGREPAGPPDLVQWRERHDDLHPSDVIRRELSARFE